MLIVISIIGILAGILFPIFTRVKSQGRATRCAANLHQIGRAFQLYVSDWSGTYPAPGGRVGDYNYWVQSGGGGIVRYVGGNGGLGTVWCCPELTRWQGRYKARSYSMNSYLRETDCPYDVDYDDCVNIFKGIRENTIEDPRRTILVYEGLPVTPTWPDSLDYIYRCGNWACVRGWFTQASPCLHTIDSWKPWHADRNNYLYCDGHIRSLVPNKYPNHPPYDTTNEWWVRKRAMAEKMKGWP